MACQDWDPGNSSLFPHEPREDLPRAIVCLACGASLEVVVHFKGKVVWVVDPQNPDFGSDQPTLRGETGNIRVVCSADVMHPCGYTCVDGVLVEAKKSLYD